MRPSVFALLLVCAAFTANAQEQAPPGSPERGYEVFMKFQCYSCHGTVGQGAPATGPKLAPNPFPYVVFARQVRNPRQDMPPYRKQFVSDQDLADIYAYLLTVKPSPGPKEIPQLNFSGETQPSGKP